MTSSSGETYTFGNRLWLYIWFHILSGIVGRSFDIGIRHIWTSWLISNNRRGRVHIQKGRRRRTSFTGSICVREKNSVWISVKLYSRALDQPSESLSAPLLLQISACIWLMGASSVFIVIGAGASLMLPELSLLLHGNDEISISGFELLRTTPLLVPSLSQLAFGPPSSSSSRTVFGLGLYFLRVCAASCGANVGDGAVGVVDVGDAAIICNLLHCGKLVGSKW